MCLLLRFCQMFFFFFPFFSSQSPEAEVVKEKKKQGRPKKEKLKDITNRGSRELANLLAAAERPRSPVRFDPRTVQQERQVMFC